MVQAVEKFRWERKMQKENFGGEDEDQIKLEKDIKELQQEMTGLEQEQTVLKELMMYSIVKQKDSDDTANDKGSDQIATTVANTDI